MVKQAFSPRAMLSSLLLLFLSCISAAAPFEYLSYANITRQLHSLAAAHPDILRVYSAQTEFSLPHTGKCQEIIADGSLQKKPCTVWVAELTKRSTLVGEVGRPELLVSGELHGNEVVGPQASMAFLSYMIRNYNSDAYVREMVDTRIVTIVPTANAIGYEMDRREELQAEPGKNVTLYDPNRDFAFGQDPRGCMRTVAARVFNELFRKRIFRVLITFHGGTNVIGYEWGDKTHCKGPKCKPAPDYRIMHALAKRLSDNAGTAGKFEPKYPIGTMGKLVYPVDGGMEDWAYGASWSRQDVQCTPNTFGGYPKFKTVYTSPMTRCITFLVETGLDKKPPVHTLGNSDHMLVQNAPGDGHVPRNVRLLLTALDSLEPYIILPAGSRIPFSSSTDKKVKFSWSVGGGFVVDGTYLQWGTKAGLNGVTRVQRGLAGSKKLGGNATLFEDSIQFNTPDIPQSALVYVRIAAVVDNSLSHIVPRSFPHVPPQSHLQRLRARVGPTWRIGNRVVKPKRVLYSKTIRVESRENHIRLTADETVKWGKGPGKIRSPSDNTVLHKLYPGASSTPGRLMDEVLTKFSVQTWGLIIAGILFVFLPCFVFMTVICCRRRGGAEDEDPEDPEVRKELLEADLLDEDDL